MATALGAVQLRPDDLLAEGIPLLHVVERLTGPVEVRGERYDGFMPPFGHLSDDELAALLSYVRSAWGNDADPVPPALVQKVRRATDSRTQPWTADELESQNP